MSQRLLLEIGNSTVKLAIVDGSGGIVVERFSNLEALLRRVENAGVRLVVASTGDALGESIIERLSDVAEISILDRSAYAGFIADSYDTPATLGFDRILNLAGLDSDAVVVSCGTAITIDALSGGRPLWGAIMPGFTTAAQGLHDRIPGLPLVSVKMPTALPARDSITSVANGVLLGVVHAAQGIARSLGEIAFGEEGRVVLTGGDADIMRGFWEEAVVDEGVLFRGMMRWE